MEFSSPGSQRATCGDFLSPHSPSAAVPSPLPGSLDFHTVYFTAAFSACYICTALRVEGCFRDTLQLWQVSSPPRARGGLSCVASFHGLLLSGSGAHLATVLGLGVWSSVTCRISDVLTSKWGFLVAQPSWMMGAQSCRQALNRACLSYSNKTCAWRCLVTRHQGSLPFCPNAKPQTQPCHGVIHASKTLLSWDVV